MNLVISDKIRLGVSSCLLGMQVRWNGAHSRESYLEQIISKYVSWTSICPEVEIGMGVPREPIRLVGKSDSEIRLVGTKSENDYTDLMQTWAQKQAKELINVGLDGYIFKKDSPSCGISRVKVYRDQSLPIRDGIGLYARNIIDVLPSLPVEDEGRLKNPKIREHFFQRVFAYHRWQVFRYSNPKLKDLINFHGEHKLTLMAHNPKGQKELGRFVAQMGTNNEDAFDSYGIQFMKALESRATPGRHVNVLTHLMGFIKKSLSQDDRNEFLHLLNQYKHGLIPLIVPHTMIKHYLRKHDVSDWVVNQTYLNPYPEEFCLQNEI